MMETLIKMKIDGWKECEFTSTTIGGSILSQITKAVITFVKLSLVVALALAQELLSYLDRVRRLEHGNKEQFLKLVEASLMAADLTLVLSSVSVWHKLRSLDYVYTTRFLLCSVLFSVAVFK